LHAFHAKHFPTAPFPAQFFYGTSETYEEIPVVDDADDDGLGYHEDGTKRTLTDEQIALFRHTEIQTILRERRLARERENEAQDAAESAPPQTSLPPTLSDSEDERLLDSDDSQAEDHLDDVSANTSSAATPTSAAAADGASGASGVGGAEVQDGRVDKDHRYRRLTKEKQRRKNMRYKRSQKQKKAEEKGSKAAE